MSTHASESSRSKGSVLAEQSFDNQVRFWRSRCNAIAGIVDSTLESIAENGSEIFGPGDGYPELPQVAISIWCNLLGFTPEKVVESELVTEALFERLPSFMQTQQNRELTGAGAR